MSLMDVLGSAFFFIGDWTFGNSFACNLQGFILQLNLATPLWNIPLATNMVIRVCFSKSERFAAKYEAYYHLFVWTLPLITSCWFLVNGSYAPSGPWCWIDAKYKIERLFVFFVPLWISMLYNAIAMVFLVRTIWKVRSAKNASKRELVNFAWKGFQYTLAMMIAVSSQNVFITSLTLHLQWLPGSVNRVHQAFSNSPVYTLVLLHAIFTPLQGALNVYVYAGNILKGTEY
jgi:hypothetical protein